jgi:hypothetical protein
MQASRTILFIILTFLSVNAINAQAKSQISLEGSVGEYLKASDYKYEKLNANAWAVELENEYVLVGAQNDFFLAGVVVAKKAQFRPTVESLTELLKLSHELDFMKVGIDADGDIFVRFEQKGKTMSKQEFYDTVERVASSAQTTRSRIKSYISSK